MSDPWDQFEDAPVAPAKAPRSEWDQFDDAPAPVQRKARRAKLSAGPLAPTGQVHDGDTFRLDDGRNARLLGVDAFERSQTGRGALGTVPLGEQARGALSAYATAGATVNPTGALTYNRPVVTLENGGDAGAGVLERGLALAQPQYLHGDEARLFDYAQRERQARLNRRGAFAGEYQRPSDFRQEGTEAVFFDAASTRYGFAPETERGYLDIAGDMRSTPEDLIAYTRKNGMNVPEASIRKFYADRARDGTVDASAITYEKLPRPVINPGDETLGAAARGLADPINMLDEMGALAESVLPVSDRENVWSSDRRFGDIYQNNLAQNRDILAYDDANHPYARFAGQLASGVVLPGASVEGVGLATARGVLRSGGTRFAAEQAARNAVTTRLGISGAIEGGLAGAGQGEDWQGRAAGAAIGAPVGFGLGVGMGVAAPVLARQIGRPFSKIVGRDGERTASDFTDGAVDTTRAGAENDLTQPRERDSFQTPTVPRAPAPRRRDPVEANTQALDEESGLGPKSILSFVPRNGEPGVSVINEDGQLAIAVYRDSNGVARGAAQIPLTPEARETFEGASVYVAPELRRQGVASRLYDALEREGHPIGEQSGNGDLTPDGAGFVSSWRRSTPMRSEVERPTINGPEMGGDRSVDRIDVNARVRPMSDQATEMERRAAADRLNPSDVLPLPANAVDGIDEAERIARGRFEDVRAPNERDALDPRMIPNANTGTPIPKRGPLDLVTWLRSEGGIRAQGGELEHAGIDNAARKLDFAEGEKRFGPLVSNTGMGYDDAAHRAWEAGFFPDRSEPPTPAEFIDALRDTHTGQNRAFRPEDLEEVANFEATRQQRYDVESARDAGAPLTRDQGRPIELDDLEANAPPVRAYEEWGENAPNLAGNIRLDKLDSPQAIKRALVRTEQVTGGFDAARRRRITQAETKSLAADLGMTADDLLKRRKGEAFNAERALAARQILARSATDLVNMAKRIARVENPGDELEAAFRESWLRHAAIQEQVSGMTAEAGRLLQQFRMTADSRDTGRALASLGDMLGGAGRIKEVAGRIVDLEQAGTTPGGINQYVLKATRPRWKDQAVELYINSLLSGPQTHAVNILSNTLTALGQIPEHVVGAAVGGARRIVERAATRAAGRDIGNPERVLFSEIGARATGLITGAKEGMSAAARSVLRGETSDATTRMESQMKAIPGAAGSFIRTPTTLLTAEDEFFKGIARRMELNALAVRQARTEGLRGAAARDRAADLVLNPPDPMLKRSFDYARYLTFQTPLEPDSFAAGISRGVQRRPEFKLLIPFVRTPVNILKFAAERSPAGLIMKSWRREFAASGSRRDVAIARMLVGTGVGAAMYEMAAAGQITGGGPADGNERKMLLATGWQPYSLKANGRYYSYARLDPFATTIGTAADLYDLSDSMGEDEKKGSAMKLLAAIVNNLSSKTWLSGLSSALEAANDPGRYLSNFVSRTVGSIAVPALPAQIARTTDPVMREARAPLDRIRSRVPGLSDDLFPRRDVLGRVVKSEGGVGPDMISPIWASTDKNDPTLKSLIAAGVKISPPNRKYTMGGKHLEWTPAQYDRLQELTGSLARPELDALAGSPDWKLMDDEERAAEVGKVMKAARGDAKGQVLSSLPAPR